MKKFLSSGFIFTLILVGLIIGNNAVAIVVPSQGPNLAGSGATSGGVGSSWTNTNRIIANDDSFSTSSISGFNHSEYLEASNFGFSIPVGATVNGIQVNVAHKASNTNAIQDRSLRLLKAGSQTGDNKGLTSTYWSNTKETISYGAYNDLWGTSWTPAQINATNFGVALAVDNSSFSSRTAYVDYVQVIVYYTLPFDNQTITVSQHAPTTSVYGNTFNVSAVASSGLTPVVITTTGGCSGGGNNSATISMTSATVSCVVHYNQAGSIFAMVNPAPEVTETTLAQPKNLTVTGIVALDKHYDQTVTATLDTSSAVLVGVVGTDDVVLNFSGVASVFSDKNVGLGKTVTISGITLSGATASNYTLTQPTATARIIERNTTATATGVNKVYDGNTDAQVVLSFDIIPGDDVSYDHVNLTAVFADPNIGVNIPIHVDHIYLTGTDALNYNLLAGFTDTVANITQDPASITLDKSNLSRTYDGNPQSIDVLSTSPSGLSNIVLYNGSTTAPTAVGSYSVLGVITDPQYAGTDSATLLINQKGQTISFGTLTDKTYGDNDFDVSATSDSGLIVTFGVSGNCSIVDTTVHITGAGSCTVIASQVGNINYSAAPDVPQTFNINKKTISVTADAKNKLVGEIDPVLTYTHDSLVEGDSFTGELARVPGETVGTYPISQGTLALNSNYTLNFTGANFSIAEVPLMYSAGTGQITYVPPTVNTTPSSTGGNEGNENGGGNNSQSGAQANGQVLGAQTFQFTRTLKLGMKGDDVLELHKKLTVLGFYKGPVDDTFGLLLRAAVKAFQKANPSLKVDGILGPKTIEVLNAK